MLSVRRIEIFEEDGESSMDDLYLKLDFSSSVYPRGPIKRQQRTSTNDVYIYTYDPKEMSSKDEYTFQQQYSLELYEGSSLLTTKSFPPSSNQTDFTIISQTTYICIEIVTHRRERLFYIPVLLKRWPG